MMEQMEMLGFVGNGEDTRATTRHKSEDVGDAEGNLNYPQRSIISIARACHVYLSTVGQRMSCP